MDQSDAGSAGLFSRRTNRTQGARVCSPNGPIGLQQHAQRTRTEGGFLGGAAGEQHGEHPAQLVLCGQGAVLQRHAEREAQRAVHTRHHAHLVEEYVGACASTE
eukprot:9496250-Pyramimonas_sp.AAC.1